MRKIISTVCWIFILSLTVENINFVCAQNEIIENTQTINISDYGIIRIKDPNNTWKWITMLDRNLWATATWAWVDESRQSFWYYFQWWNNYGFPSDPNAEISTTTTQVDASNYWPNTENGYYSSDTFILWNDDWSNVRNDNLRWWSGDSRDGNGRWYPVVNPEDRRWPCPENYHVPSIWEWSKLLEFWANNYAWSLALSTDYSTNLKYFEDNTIALNDFYSDLYIPMAGKRLYQNIWYAWTQVLLRSSSSRGLNAEILSIFWINPNLYSNMGTQYRTNAFPIRCFYNSYWLPVKITYNVNWWYRTNDEVAQQKTITYTKEDDNSEYSWDILLWKVKRDNNCWANKDKNCMFVWWYTLNGDNLWTWNISEDITLYAKWLPYEEKDVLLSGVAFSIMDRNLWAVNSWINEDAYGYYLTWWEKDIVCPEWYHIPSTWEWLWIKKLLGSDFNWDFLNSVLNLPFAGKIENDAMIETGENGYYLSKNGDETMYAKISNSNIEIEDFNVWDKVSVRCFKDYSVWTIKFNSNGWNNVTDMETVNWREDWENLAIPTKDHSVFLWWYNQNDVKIEKNVNYKNEEEISLYAKWECEQWYQENENKCEKISKSSGWSSGWGGRWSGPEDINMSSWTNVGELTWNAQGSFVDNSVSEWQILPPSLLRDEEDSSFPINKGDTALAGWTWQKDFSQEFVDAYNFAYKNWITTKTSIYDAKMYSPLTRIQMAKMLSYYAINVLWKRPDVSKWTIKFDDISGELNKQYGNAVTLSYQLWIMWQNIKNNIFRPYDKVNRAEFATALSRLLYWTEDWKWENAYYDPHITKLYNEWIINKIDITIEEKRGYAMIMFMRKI